jgi:hypothetical protein
MDRGMLLIPGLMIYQINDKKNRKRLVEPHLSTSMDRNIQLS